jgi:hypothetical protein
MNFRIMVLAAAATIFACFAYAQDEEPLEEVMVEDPVTPGESPDPEATDFTDTQTDTDVAPHIPEHPIPGIEPLPADTKTPEVTPDVFDANSRAIDRAEQRCDVGNACSAQ